MPDSLTPITQAGLDRVEHNLREADRINVEHIRELREADNLRYEQRFKDSEKAVVAALNAAKEATSKAEAASEKRFDAVNEFRGTLADQQRMLMPRLEAEQRMGELAKQIDELKTTNVQLHGQTEGSKNLWGYIVGVLGVLAILYSFFKS